MFPRRYACIAFAAFCALTSASVQAQTLKALYQFGTNTHDPMALTGQLAIAQGRDGELYSTSQSGGTSNVGTLFKVSPAGTMTVVYDFVYNPGNDPHSGATIGTDGNFYGTTELNSEGPGTAWKITPAGVAKALHIFANSGDGACPTAAPIQGADGNFYGTTTTICGFGSLSTVYKLTSTGTLTTLYTFKDNSNVNAPVVQGTDGNFYGVTENQGTHGNGYIFKLTPVGKITVLYNFTSTDGSQANSLIQANDGNFYGTTYVGGGSSAGVIFKITPGGTYTLLHTLNGTSDGSQPTNALVQAADGKLYGAAQGGGSSSKGAIFSITTSGTYVVVANFDGTNGASPQSPLKQNTNGILYGDTSAGGDLSLCSGNGCGVFYSLNIGAEPFIKLSGTSGNVGSQVGIFGQEFDSASVVKFNGVAATKITLSGTTYITATVPAGATDGRVTVTTGATTLTSTQTYIVHNTWSQGKAMPTATARSSAAVLGGDIYVIGGTNTSGTVISDVQIYNPNTNTWSSGTALPNATQNSSAAVVNNVLYVFGGDNGITTPTNAVWAYSPSSKKWTAKAAMPTARNGTLAVVENNIVYVMGGNLGGGANFVATVESYNPATNTWKTEASMDGAKDFPAGGLIGATIVAADGALSGGGVTGDTEAYNATTNQWSELTADPTPRTSACSGAIGGVLYDIGGYINNGGAATTANESFNLSTDKWTTTLVPMSHGTMLAASAVANGQLYCIGGWATLNGTSVDYVQAYQP